MKMPVENKVKKYLMLTSLLFGYLFILVYLSEFVT